MTAIMFHHFHDNKTWKPSQGSLPAEQFKQLLEANPHVDLVFDDGLKCQFDIAVPVLKDLGRKAIFCVTTGHFEDTPATVEPYRWLRHELGLEEFYRQFHNFVVRPSDNPDAFPDFYTKADRQFQLARDSMKKKSYNSIMKTMIKGYRNDAKNNIQTIAKQVYLSKLDLQNLSQMGFEVGLHSHTHPMNMANLTASEQRTEWMSNFDWVHSATGKVPITASYPSNSYNGVTMSILKREGITKAYRADEEGHRRLKRMELPRIDHHEACIRAGIKI
jgi:peptidoglycan/xylan/chitin deacetylase (PgdA/CDA1 family)